MKSENKTVSEETKTVTISIEEYEAFQTNESREDQTLEISKKSDKKSTISLWIASISALISLGSLIIAILKQ